MYKFISKEKLLNLFFYKYNERLHVNLSMLTKRVVTSSEHFLPDPQKCPSNRVIWGSDTLPPGTQVLVITCTCLVQH